MAEIKDEKLIFKVATYNIAALGYCLDDHDAIARDIAETDADIVGLQEIDMFLHRSGEIDMAADIAQAAGYPHHRFIRAVDYKGGQYGTAILSKHPIERLKVIDLPSAVEERSIGIFVINVLGEKINYFNTHFSYVESEAIDHLGRLSKIVEDYSSYVITADFNANGVAQRRFFGNHRLANPDEGGIDNIIMTEDFDYSNAELGNDVHSDHRMLTATLTKALY